jgi:hypothetical protein
MVDPDKTRIYTSDTIAGFGVGNLTGQVSNYVLINPKNYFIGINSGRIFNHIGVGNQHNMFVGHETGYNMINGHDNTFLGYQAGYSANQGGMPYTGINNTYIGSGAGRNNQYGYQNVMIGMSAGSTANPASGCVLVGSGTSIGTGGGGHVVIGENASCGSGMFGTIVIGEAARANGNAGIILGYNAGYQSSSDSSIFLGYCAGRYETNDNRLYISNKWVTSQADAINKALIYGEFDNQKVRINGALGINATPLYKVHSVDNTTTSDAPAVYGSHDVTDGYGVGVEGRGRYRGVRGYSLSNYTGTIHGIYGYASNSGTGGGYGIYGAGYATSGTAYGIYATANSTSGTEFAGYFSGNVNVTGTLSKGGGSFKIDHPLDPENKYLYHSFVESPDMKNIYDGVVVLDNNGHAIVTMENWFEAVNYEFRYQLTSIGAPGPNLYISKEISNNQFEISGGTPGMKVSWMVTGVRHDPFANKHRIPVEVEKDKEDKGKYLYPDAYNLPDEKGIDFKNNNEREK